MAIESWKLSEWIEGFREAQLPSMTSKEIAEAIAYLRGHQYCAPTDCTKESCLEYRPACSLGICKIAICMCGDW
jgi:hypothetical protein